MALKTKPILKIPSFGQIKDRAVLEAIQQLLVFMHQNQSDIYDDLGRLNLGNVIPGGSDDSIQYNDAGLLNGSTSFNFDKTTNSLVFGPLNTNGSWRIRVNGNNLVQERRESGVWVEKVAAVP